MRVRHLIGFIAVVFAVGIGTAVPTSAETNLVANGGFEAPVVPDASFSVLTGSALTGWTTTGNVDLVNKNFQTSYPVHGGNQSLDLNNLSPASITQDIATTPGATYQVVFYLSGVPNPPECNQFQNTKELTVTIGDVTKDILFEPNLTAVPNTNQVFDTESFEYTATAATTTLTFTSLTVGCAGPIIDDISVTLPTPAPPAVVADQVVAQPAFTG